VAFRRALGTFDATMLVVGGIIGAGIFVNPYLVAQRLPSAGPILWVWIAGGAIALAGALAFAELASLYPMAGGEYAYLREAYHPLVAFLFGWASFLMIQGGGIAAVSIAFSEHALRFAGSPQADPKPLAIAAIAATALVNVVGVKPGSRVLNVLVLVKILSLAALILGGLWVARRLPPLPSFATADRPSATPLAFAGALVPILFSYGGWQNANTVAEEMRSPEKSLPRALIAGTLLVVVIYVAVNVVYLMTLGRDGLAATVTPAAAAVRRLFGPRADAWITAAIAVSTLGFVHMSFLGPTRISFAMARDGVFFRSLGELHPRFGTPHRAILLQAFWCIVLVLTGTYGGLIDSVVFADWIFFGLAVVAVIPLRRRIPPSARPAGAFLTPGTPWIPILFAAAAVFAVAGAARSNPVRSGIGVLMMLAGIPIYYAWRGAAKRRAS
jgi:basic amino acid/polyamine antiporter, APA family